MFGEPTFRDMFCAHRSLPMTMVAAAFDERPPAFFWRFHRFQLLL